MSQTTRYILVVVISFLLSAAGIVVGAFVTDPSDGGRGGAIAVAFAFFVFFVRQDYGARVYEAIVKDLPALAEDIKNLAGSEPGGTPRTQGGDDVSVQVAAIVSRLKTESDGQRKQNIALAVASIIGTLAWGFGDVIAKSLK